jgi:DNA-3-methyladenine glycosylase I
VTHNLLAPALMHRCPWAKTELSIAYHDSEWGVPVHDDRLLFEFLVLEGAQAGLSWETILKKRVQYRRVFDNFQARKVARYGERRIQTLLADPGIIRNRLKIEAAIRNAKAFLAVQKEFGSFDQYLWSFVGGTPKVNSWTSIKQVPASTPDSDRMSRDLRKRGFKFVGSTICYAFMQAVGMVNDHLADCFRFPEIRRFVNELPSAGFVTGEIRPTQRVVKAAEVKRIAGASSDKFRMRREGIRGMLPRVPAAPE